MLTVRLRGEGSTQVYSSLLEIDGVHSLKFLRKETVFFSKKNYQSGAAWGIGADLAKYKNIPRGGKLPTIPKFTRTHTLSHTLILTPPVTRPGPEQHPLREHTRTVSSYITRPAK